MNNFLEDVWRGLNATPKHLDSKYFYDDAGDAIFREIMDCPEYYLTNCELEIFKEQSSGLAASILARLHDFDVVELGAGDCTKSIYLLSALLKQKGAFTFCPVDISPGVIASLSDQLPDKLPGIHLQCLNGDHFDMLEVLKQTSAKNKIVLFLGSSIGNILLEDTAGFFGKLKTYLVPGDLVLTGFDLKKSPGIILAAYNDKAGITARFNFNLLHRINTVLGADFDISQFAHRPTYSERDGACRSYLESLKNQQVRIGSKGSVSFNFGEKIFMEVSQKYTDAQIDATAAVAGFTPVAKYYDSKRWFVDALWQL